MARVNEATGRLDDARQRWDRGQIDVCDVERVRVTMLFNCGDRAR